VVCAVVWGAGIVNLTKQDGGLAARIHLVVVLWALALIIQLTFCVLLARKKRFWEQEECQAVACFVDMTIVMMSVLLLDKNELPYPLGNPVFCGVYNGFVVFFGQLPLVKGIRLHFINCVCFAVTEIGEVVKTGRSIPLICSDCAVHVVAGLMLPLLLTLYIESNSRFSFVTRRGLPLETVGPFWLGVRQVARILFHRGGF
jgi:hypothetical protein